MKQYHPKNKYEVYDSETGEVVLDTVWVTHMQAFEYERNLLKEGSPLRYRLVTDTKVIEIARDYSKSMHYWY